MLEQILQYLKNWFIVNIHQGDFAVQDGSIELPFLQEGQYFRIMGSIFNDGLHQYPAGELTDEEFRGVIWAMAVPQDVVKLSAEIEEWQTKNGQALTSPYQSESFGGYSYTKAVDENGNGMDWRKAFASRLKYYRKVREV